jgi:cytochrome c peroxidase
MGTLIVGSAILSWQDGLSERAAAVFDDVLTARLPGQPGKAHLAALRRIHARPSTAWPASQLDADAVRAELGPWQAATNPLPAARVELGRRLFDDPILSASGQISCQNCHHPELGWGDGLSRSVGHGRARGMRNAPALFNAAHRRSIGWDGHAHDLADQLRRAMTDPGEMGGQPLAAVLARLNADAGYRQRFAAAFGDGPITGARLDDALIVFLTTLERPTPLDRFLTGDRSRLTDQQVWGMHLFRTKGRCMNCHAGPLLSDERFHNLGLSFFKQPAEDLGRYRATGNPEDAGRFRTPSLRHIARTAPYMHNGMFKDLRSVVVFYTQGGGETRVRNDREAADPLYPFVMRKAALLQPVALSAAEIDAVTAFLAAL